MRILIFHGYLLRGTGSNVYNAELAAALLGLDHEVHLLCQDRAPFDLGWVDAAGDWDTGALRLHTRRETVRGTVYRPDIGGLLPVYVADRYDGVEARPFPELSDAELDRYLESNVSAVSEVVGSCDPDVALANHLVMGPAILARALAGTGVPYAVKVHGSALEYTVKPHRRFLPHAREGLAGARAVLVGSRHTAESLWAVLDDSDVRERTRLGPPGVDVQRFSAREPEEALAGLSRLARRLSDGAGAPAEADDSAFARHDRAAGRAVEQLTAAASAGHPLVVFVGKLIVSKGIDLLIAAWPLVLARVPEARLGVVGFGAYREAAAGLVSALAAEDEAALGRAIDEGRAAEGGPRTRLRLLGAFLDALEGERRKAYFAAARLLPERVVLTGRLEHSELTDLLPASEALVVPSTFPEAFGMVAAEAAACGVLPISADHSGLAEVSAELAASVPSEAAGMLSFQIGPVAVADLAARIVAWLQAPAELRARTRSALVQTARERYSWEEVGRRVIAAAEGRLDELPTPGGAA